MLRLRYALAHSPPACGFNANIVGHNALIVERRYMDSHYSIYGYLRGNHEVILTCLALVRAAAHTEDMLWESLL